MMFVNLFILVMMIFESNVIIFIEGSKVMMFVCVLLMVIGIFFICFWYDSGLLDYCEKVI